MTALWIILGILAAIIAVIYILLHIYVCAYLEASNNGVKLTVKYLWFKLWHFDSNESKTENESSEEASESSEENIEPVFEFSEIQEIPEEVEEETEDESEDDADDSSEDQSDSKLYGLKAKIDEYMPYLPVAKKAFRKLVKIIRFYDFDLSITVGDTDAAKAGKRFGEVNGLVYSVLGLLCSAFTVKIKRTNINCLFDEKKLEADLATVIKVRPSAVVCLAIYLGINYLRINRKNKKIKSSEKELNNNE